MTTLALDIDSHAALTAELYGLHADELLAYLSKATGDRDAAADLLHETFVRAFQARSLEQVDKKRAWLYRVATNLARSHLRRRRLLAFVPFSGAEQSGDRGFDAEAQHIHQALRAISPRHATTLVLHYQAGFSRADIARMEDVSEHAIKARLARGRAQFIAAYRRLGRETDARTR